MAGAGGIPTRKEIEQGAPRAAHPWVRGTQSEKTSGSDAPHTSAPIKAGDVPGLKSRTTKTEYGPGDI
jgi:hypothetical protein